MTHMIGNYRSTTRGGLGRELITNPMTAMTAIAALPEPIVRGRAGGIPIWFVTSPELAAEVLQAGSADFGRNLLVNQVFKEVSGENLFTASGPPWAWRRRAIAPAFAARPLAATSAPVHLAIEQQLAGWPNERTVDAQELTLRLALHAAATGLFGADLPAASMDRVSNAIATITRWVNRRLDQPFALPGFVPTKSNKQMKAARHDLGLVVREVIRAGAAAEGRVDLLHHLLRATDPETGMLLDEDALETEAMVLLFAGHETTAGAAAWTLELLARHPNIQQTAREEVDRIASNGPVAEQLDQLEFVRAIVNETLRLYPPAWGIPRMLRSGTMLGPAKIRRFQPVIVAVAAMHRDAEHWDDPEAFDPARFIGTKAASSRAFMPFGIGPRQCVGARFATNELILFVASLLETRTVRPATSRRAIPDAAFGLRAKGAELIFSAR